MEEWKEGGDPCVLCKTPKWLCTLTEVGESQLGVSRILWNTDTMEKNRAIIKYMVIVPCRQCMNCRINYSQEWKNRLIAEAQQWDESYFVTLTYNDQNLPSEPVIDPKTGEVKTDINGDQVIAHPLVKKHLQDFNKRIRRHWDYQDDHQGIRIYGVGEYGDQTGRPHYHEILYNLPLANNLIYMGNRKRTMYGKTVEYNLYWSQELQDLWPFGQISIGEVNETTCAYVAGYALKKHKGKEAASWYQERGLTPEFAIGSRNPGIGMNYFDQHKDRITETESMTIKTAWGGNIVPIPKGFGQAARRYETIDKHGKTIKARYPLEEIEKAREDHAAKLPEKMAAAESYYQLLQRSSTKTIGQTIESQGNVAEAAAKTKKGVL